VPSGGVPRRPAVPAQCNARRTASRSVRHPAPRSPRRALWRPEQQRLVASSSSPHRKASERAVRSRLTDKAASPSQQRRAPERGVGCLAERASGGGRASRWYGGPERRSRKARRSTRRQRHPEICAPAGSAVYRVTPAATRVESRRPAARSGAEDYSGAGDCQSAVDDAGASDDPNAAGAVGAAERLA
jgi:hypothetical protein